MNSTINVLKNHRTYREFDQTYELPDDELQQILDASRQAPSWMNGQFYTIMVIKDHKIREQLVQWNPGNPHMLESSVFLIFVADLKRTALVSQSYQSDYFVDESIEPLIIATTDAALALENAVIATESLGLGSVVVGSIRKHAKEITELVHLPELMMPLFGLSIGKPVTQMSVKPRLPEAAVIHYDTYHPYAYTLIEQYDQIMNAFGEARETKTWSQKFSDFFATKPAMVSDQFAALQKIYKPKQKRC